MVLPVGKATAPRMKDRTMPNLLIVGGGYAGLWAAMAAARRAADANEALNIRLLSKDPYLTHRPRLYERNPQDMRSALAPVLAPIDVDLALGTVTAIDPVRQQVQATGEDGAAHTYDYDALILAAGSVLRPPPINVAKGRTWSVDSMSAAIALDQQLKQIMDGSDSPTVVIIGAGFTGIELATEMRSRLAEHGPTDWADRAGAARVILADAAATVSPDLGPGPRPHILEALEAAGVEVRLNTTVTAIDGERVSLGDGEKLTSRAVIVTTGAQANSLAGQLATALNLKTDPSGRLMVDEDLAVIGAQSIFAAGDIAHAMTDPGSKNGNDDGNGAHPALMSCQHAMPMGKFAGHNAAAHLLGHDMTPYEQTRYVTCLDLGPWGAVFTTGWDRQVEMTGAEAKARKQFIMNEVIYPPSNDRTAILEAGGL